MFQRRKRPQTFGSTIIVVDDSVVVFVPELEAVFELRGKNAFDRFLDGGIVGHARGFVELVLEVVQPGIIGKRHSFHFLCRGSSTQGIQDWKIGVMEYGGCRAVRFVGAFGLEFVFRWRYGCVAFGHRGVGIGDHACSFRHIHVEITAAVAGTGIAAEQLTIVAFVVVSSVIRIVVLPVVLFDWIAVKALKKYRGRREGPPQKFDGLFAPPPLGRGGTALDGMG